MILKWKTRKGQCTHKQNNAEGLKKIDCIPKYCPYFEECKLEYEDKITFEELFEIMKDEYKK